MISKDALNEQQKSIVTIAALTANGNLEKLKPAIEKGLDAGLTVNQIKEVIVHLYAYAGFPRSIRGLQTFMEVLDQHKDSGIKETLGADATPKKMIPVNMTGVKPSLIPY